jgi:hypothetical protein
LAPLRAVVRRLAVVVVAGAALVLTSAAPADAHTVTGVQATNYRSQIDAVTPAEAGIRVRLLDLGNRIELVDTGPAEVVVLGYQGEPYLRVGPAGVFENIRSPAHFLNRVTGATTTNTTLPRQADASAPPQWHKTGDGRSARWRDRRTRWADPAPPAVRADPGSRHVMSVWTIGLIAQDRPIQVSGRITYVPGPSALPWILAAAAVGLLTVAVGLRRRWGPPLAAAVALLVAVDAVHSFGIAAASHDAVFVQVARVIGGGLVATLGWVLGAIAVGPLQEERETGLVSAGVAGFLLGVFSGIGDLPTLGRSQLPYVFPAVTARAAAAATIGLGFGLTLAVLVVLRRHPDLVKAS